MIQLKDGSRSIYEGKMKLPELVTWVLPHALEDDEKVDADLNLDSEKEKQSTTSSGKIKIIHTFDDFE